MEQRLKLTDRIKIFSLLVVTVIAGTILDCQLCYPKAITLFEGEQLKDAKISAFSLEKTVSEAGVLHEDGRLKKDSYNHAIELQSGGEYQTSVKLFGVVPVRTVAVHVEPATELVPGGRTVGIKIFTEGILCVGTQAVQAENGRPYDVARQEDIREGDIFLRAQGEALKETEQLARLLAESRGEPIQFLIRRNGRELQKEVSPIKTGEGYKLGFWMRDSTAGVGTLSYSDPESGAFGALGHAITDADTGALMPVSEGSLLRADIVGITKGKVGEPGELKAVFNMQEELLGVIHQNTPQGVFGTLNHRDEAEKRCLVASGNQVRQGKATILCNIEGEKTEEFQIEIQKTSRYHLDAHKDMVIRVTDERLLEKTGGIVQGMSGSPILQNGKIVGAVTHVFVNDPTRGYGIFIENMLAEAEKIR